MQEIRCEVAVLGGGPSGLAAAITAARAGRDVVLVEQGAYLGGVMALGISPLSMLDKSGKFCTGGFAAEFLDRLEQRGDSLGTDRCPKHNSVTSVNAEGVKILALEMCREAGVRLLLHAQVLDAGIRDGRIAYADLFGKCNRIRLYAECFVDCTGDGDLAFLAGCSYEKSPVLQPPTVVFMLENVDTERLIDYVAEHPEELRYNDPAIYENPDYTAEHFRSSKSYVFVGLQASFRRWKEQGVLPVQRTSFICIRGTNPGEVYVNSVRMTDTDATDLFDLTRAEAEGTLQIPKLVALLKAEIPGFENCFVSSVGPTIGVRETRRILGRKYIGRDDVLEARVPEDTVALSGYKVDIHSGNSDGLRFIDLERPFGIPYGCLVSRDLNNLLLAGRCISCDEVALGSLRVIPPCMATGHAAGVAAALAAAEKTDPGDLETGRIREILLRQGAVLMPG